MNSYSLICWISLFFSEFMYKAHIKFIPHDPDPHKTNQRFRAVHVVALPSNT